MFLVQSKNVTTICVILFFALGFGLAVTAKLSDPQNSYELVARERGGVYLGTAGVVMQDKNNTCGPAALKMILDVYGKRVPLRELEEGRKAFDGGWTMQSLKELAEHHGLRAEGWRLDPEAICRSRFPLILFVEDRHFVVADGVDTAGFLFIRDPAIGRMKIHRCALGRIWNGEALVFGENELPVE